MPLLGFTLIAEIIFALSFTSVLARPSVNSQVLCMMSGPGQAILWAICLSRIPAKSQKLMRGMAIGVLPLLPVLSLGAFSGGVRLREYLFFRDLPHLQEVVRDIENGSIPLGENRKVEVPEKYHPVARKVHAWREENGSLTAVFFMGGFFPVKHLVYLYSADEQITAKVKRDWSGGRKRAPHWYEVWD